MSRDFSLIKNLLFVVYNFLSKYLCWHTVHRLCCCVCFTNLPRSLVCTTWKMCIFFTHSCNVIGEGVTHGYRSLHSVTSPDRLMRLFHALQTSQQYAWYCISVALAGSRFIYTFVSGFRVWRECRDRYYNCFTVF